jgi:hypothetical protein
MLKTKLLTGFLALSLPVALLACNGDDDDDVAGIPGVGDDTPTPAAQQQETPTPSPTPAQDDIEFNLDDIDNSGYTGEVRMETVGNQTRVIIEIDDDADDRQTTRPAAIYAGTCDDFDNGNQQQNQQPVFPLEDVVNGRSETTLNAGLQQILDRDHVVVVSESRQQMDRFVACGDIDD